MKNRSIKMRYEFTWLLDVSGAFTFVWRPEKKVVRRGTEYDDMLILLTTIVMLAGRWISLSRHVDSKSEVSSYPVARSPSRSIDVDTSRRGQRVRARLYQMYLSARSASKYCDHLRAFVELRSAGKTISGSAPCGKAWRAKALVAWRRNSHPKRL